LNYIGLLNFIYCVVTCDQFEMHAWAWRPLVEFQAWEIQVFPCYRDCVLTEGQK
jgi:hypothetical protein